MLAVDNFTRSNTGPPPSGSWTTARALGLKIVSNKCVPQTDSQNGAACWSAACVGPDQEVSVTIGTVATAVNSGAMAACVRVQAANAIDGNHYELGVALVTSSLGAIDIWKEVSSVYTQLGSRYAMGRAITTSDVFTLRVTGNLIEALLNGVVVISQADSAVPTGAYVGLYYQAATGGAWSSFIGGDLVPAGERSSVFIGSS